MDKKRLNTLSLTTVVLSLIINVVGVCLSGLVGLGMIMLFLFSLVSGFDVSSFLFLLIALVPCCFAAASLFGIIFGFRALKDGNKKSYLKAIIFAVISVIGLLLIAASIYGYKPALSA